MTRTGYTVKLLRNAESSFHGGCANRYGTRRRSCLASSVSTELMSTCRQHLQANKQVQLNHWWKFT